jgi:hypothetical protein
MSPNDLVEDLRQKPFEPFRLYVTDGSIYEVRHPELCLVGVASVILGLNNDPNSTVFERTVRIDCRHIVKSEPIKQTPAVGGNGQPQ